MLKSGNASLIQQIKNLNSIKEELSRYQHSGINVD